MRKSVLFYLAVLAATALSCSKSAEVEEPEPAAQAAELELSDVAKILSCLPLGEENLSEVHDAVSGSTGNGYDEEYMMQDLFSSPGSGVGSGGVPTKAGGYSRPLRDLIEQYVMDGGAPGVAVTKAGGAREYLESLSASDIQIYWPYSDSWDGESYPIVTFDPGFGSESNYGYEIIPGPDGVTVVDSVYVDESIAAERPVWVVNRNDDSAFTPLEMFRRNTKAPAPARAGTDGSKMLLVKDFTMLRNYDSWFGGASEFFVKCGAVDGFKATKDDDLKLYTPSVTDFMISVKRSQVKKAQPFECILLTDFTDQMDKIAFLVIEDDGGTTTSWKCEATVKYQSKTYGFDIEIPYKDKDDIVWRGQLSQNFFDSQSEVQGRFGDVIITFSLQ